MEREPRRFLSHAPWCTGCGFDNQIIAHTVWLKILPSIVSIVALLRCCTVAPLHHCSGAVLHCCMHRCTVAPLHCCTSCCTVALHVVSLYSAAFALLECCAVSQLNCCKISCTVAHYQFCTITASKKCYQVLCCIFGSIQYIVCMLCMWVVINRFEMSKAHVTFQRLICSPHMLGHFSNWGN